MKNIILIISILFVSAFAKAQELQSYIQEAESNNPEIQKFVCGRQRHGTKCMPNYTIESSRILEKLDFKAPACDTYTDLWPTR